jgi:predicted NUDIX family NTP pyrophosphohydrolase
MPVHSAGILLYQSTRNGIAVLLVHPGGPFWAKRDLKSWSIPKGEFGAGDDARQAARREFEEELGIKCPPGDGIALGDTVQRSGKRVTAWALVCRRSDYDGLVYAENGQLLWRDEQLDAASDTGLLVDQAELVEGLEHLVD